MDNTDNFSGNNNNGRENEPSDSYPYNSYPSQENHQDDYSSNEENYSFNSDGTYSYSNQQRQDQTPVEQPAENNNRQDNYNDGAYRSQTPPPYGYYRRDETPPRSNVNPYSQGNPYPYANRNNQNASVSSGNNSNGKKTIKIIVGVVIVLLVLLIASVVGLVISSPSTENKKEETTTAASAETEIHVDEAVTSALPSAPSSHTDGKLSPKEIFNKISATSVGIIAYDKGEGSGVLLKEDKESKYTYIITCAHVVKGAKKIVVELSDNTEYQAELVGYDERTDIAVLKIEATGLKLAEIGDSEAVSVGDNVYAIGNPGGTSFAGSFTNGMISALDRPVNSESGYTMKCIQHTAAINPGNSGGALVNAYGQLIGINSSKIVSEDYEGMGFSVPSSVFVDIFNSIVTNGYVGNRAKIGFRYLSASNYNSSYGMYVAIKGLPAGSLVICDIDDDSDLLNTDVEKGDMITAVNGKKLDDAAILAEMVENGSVGDVITLSIVRINDDYSCSEFDVKVKLVEDKKGTNAEEETTTSGEYSMEDYFRQYFGDDFADFFGGFGSGSYGSRGYGSDSYGR